ncbi:MAG TPA: ROK family protein [Terriglobales bacterium]|jgi:glucokinase|nr:ROK family protein [Terriglobales bacterium]
MSSYAIGVDLGGTNLRISAVDSDGNLLHKITSGAQVAKGRDFVVAEMTEAIRQLSVKFSSLGELEGIGIGVPGIIDKDTGIVRKSPNLPDWINYPVREEVERRLGTHVILENDANVAALGEKWLGAGREVDSLCMITVGTGVGGGLVLNGKIWRGMTGMAGEIGHMNVEPNGPPCGCGSHGCLEQLASATAIKRMAIEAITKGESPELGRAMKEEPEFSSLVVYQKAVQGDPVAQRIFRRVGTALGMTIASLVNVLNLPMYALFGGVVNAWDAFAPAMMEEIHKRSFVYVATESQANLPNTKKTIVTRALLGSDAGLYGAARLAMLEPHAMEKIEA